MFRPRASASCFGVCGLLSRAPRVRVQRVSLVHWPPVCEYTSIHTLHSLLYQLSLVLVWAVYRSGIYTRLKLYRIQTRAPFERASLRPHAFGEYSLRLLVYRLSLNSRSAAVLAHGARRVSNWVLYTSCYPSCHGDSSGTVTGIEMPFFRSFLLLSSYN